MILLLFICLLMFVFLFFSIPVIEASCICYIAMVIFYFILGKMGVASSASIIISFLLTLLLLISLKKLQSDKITKENLDKKKFNINFNIKELNYILAFAFLYTCFYILNLSWGDFISIGERLRDYSILASVIHSPIDVKEPWFSGLTLNYYAFWYRAGALVSYVFNYEVFETYHILSTLNTTFFVMLVFVILNKYLSFSFFRSVLLTFLVFPGSNINGIKFFFSADTNWWGPSRVIKGAITEFPAWSFVLGDIHPHFLNLLFFPLIVLLLLSFTFSKQDLRQDLEQDSNQNKINNILLFISFYLFQLFSHIMLMFGMFQFTYYCFLDF